MPLPVHVRQEFDWLASSLEIEHLVLPVLDRRVGEHEFLEDGPTNAESQDSGFDVPMAQFRKLVVKVLDTLPEEFRRAMDNVAIAVEEIAESEIAEGRELFGVYIGVPLTKRTLWHARPDRIIIYRRTICAYCDSAEELKAQVYRTVIHEIAHHFGIDDPRLRALGW
jgi:predicted Zn-dependent protease with MMP-like domain